MSALHRKQHKLIDIVRNVILPQVELNGMTDIFTACPEWQPNMSLPEGMSVTRKPIRGTRIPAHRGRPYGPTMIEEAQWPEDHLSSARTAKLYFVLRLPATLQIADYQLHCLPGHGILVPPGIPFSANKAPGVQPRELLQIMPYYAGLLCWTVEHWRDAAQKQRVREHTHSIPRSQAASYLRMLAEEAPRDTPHCRLLCDSLLRILLILLLREMEELPVLYTGIMNETPLPSSSAYSLQQLQEFVERDLRRSLSIERAARYAGMSRTVFTAWFRARTGKTFNRYVQDLRFDAACELLRGGDLSIYNVATAVGLNPNRMRSMFHEREGISPLEYRRKSRRNLSIK